MASDNDILRKEINLLIIDIIKAYEKSGKKTTGEFERGLKAKYSSSGTKQKAVIWGYEYLAGRGKTKKGHSGSEPYLVESILIWLKAKGIRPRESKMKLSSLAWAIATKIHKKGTRIGSSYKIYQDVITRNRLYEIVNRLSVINEKRIINKIQAELKLLSKKS